MSQSTPKTATDDRSPIKRAVISPDVVPLTVTIPTACAIVGIQRSSLYREIGAKRLRAVKSGKRTLITVESLQQWLASLPTAKIGR